jgi:hypothetical protein
MVGVSYCVCNGRAKPLPVAALRTHFDLYRYALRWRVGRQLARRHLLRTYAVVLQYPE